MKRRNILCCGIISLSLAGLTACDEHEYIEPYTIGNSVLCEDGEIMDTTSCRLTGETPIAVVFYTKGDSVYAVWLKETSALAFSDHTAGIQGTSLSITSDVGFTNTANLLKNDSIKSPIAEATVGIWSAGQSAFVPSVNEMNLLQQHAVEVNQVLQWCQTVYPSSGTVLLPLSDQDCWYWTSTEVSSTHAYLYSIRRCYSEQSTPKVQAHKARPIVIVRK